MHPTITRAIPEFETPIVHPASILTTGVDLPFGWWEPAYLTFRNLASHFGLHVDVHQMFCNGFYQPEAGCSYHAEIDTPQLLSCWHQNHWQTLLSVGEFTLPELKADPTIIRQLEDGSIRAEGHVRAYKNKTRVYVAMQFRYPAEVGKNYKAVDAEIERFVDAVIELCDELNQVLFIRLLRAYETLVYT